MTENFDVSVVYCYPCVLHLVKFEILRRSGTTQALLTDFVKARIKSSILIETFQSNESILFTFVFVRTIPE